MRYCSSCRRSGYKEPADWFVQAIIDTGYHRVPYRAYLCNDHIEVLLDNVVRWIKSEPVSQAAWAIRERELWAEYEEEKKRNNGRPSTPKAARLHKAFCHAQDMAGHNN